MLFRNAVEFTQMAFGLTPEVLNPVNVVLPVCKTGAVIDAQVVKLANIQYIVGTVAISINHAVRPYLLPDNRQQGSRLRIGYGNGVNLTVTLQQSEYRRFAGCSATAFAFAAAAKITFICFYFAIKHFQVFATMKDEQA